MTHGTNVTIFRSTLLVYQFYVVERLLGIEETKNGALWTSRIEDTTTEAG